MKHVHLRQALVQKGDRLIAEARRMIRDYATEHGYFPQAWVYEYWLLLNEADNAYRAAGLGLLAGRVAFLARRVAEYGVRENARDSLTKFDRLNAGGCGVA
jgi:hypothetical protein